jgi:hypothetical protein
MFEAAFFERRDCSYIVRSGFELNPCQTFSPSFLDAPGEQATAKPLPSEVWMNPMPSDSQ